LSQAAYSNLKPAWHMDKIADLRAGRMIVPSQVHFIISDLCNHDCHFCAYRMSGGFSTELFADGEVKNPNRVIPTEKCIEILNDMAECGVKAVQFTGGGEPTVHKDHMEIFRHALGLGLECALVTNGALLRPGWKEVLPHFKWVRVSVDAGDAKTYGAVRRISPSVYDRVLRHIEHLSAEIKSVGSDCLLGVGYVVTEENWQTLYEGCSRLRAAGAPYVRLSAMFSEQGSEYYKGNYEDICNEIRRAKQLEDSKFSVVDLFSDRINDLDQGRPDYRTCGYQQFVVYIGGDQNVYRCCTTSYTKHGLVGSLKEQRFSDWLSGDERKKMVDGFNAKSCHHCQFNDKNRAINYMTEEHPTHVNFV